MSGAGKWLGAAVALTFAPIVARAEILLDHPWAQATPPKATVGRAYLTITNHSDETEHLVGVRTNASSAAEISGVRILQNVPNLRRLFNIDIPPERSIIFAPGSYHILLRNLKKPLLPGDYIAAELVFEKAGAVPVTFVVETGGAASGR